MFRLMILATTLFILGCGNYRNEKAPSGPTEPAAKGSVLYDFATIYEQVIAPNCITCHTDNDFHKNTYSRYGFVKRDAQKIINRINLASPPKRMPKAAAPLDPALITMFEQWVAQGAPEFIEDTGGEDTNTGTGDTSTNISFEQMSDRVFKKYNCTSCHSQYKSYSVVQDKLSNIVSVIQNKSMPYPKRPNGEVDLVSAEDFEYLLKWVEQDAPEFSDRPAVKVPEEELKPEWISLRNKVFGPKCVLCHNSFGRRGPRSIATYQEMRDWFDREETLFNFRPTEANPSYGLLVDSLLRPDVPVEPPEDSDEFEVYRMPYNRQGDDVKDIDRLTDQEIEVIKEWIKLKLPFEED